MLMTGRRGGVGRELYGYGVDEMCEMDGWIGCTIGRPNRLSESGLHQELIA
jgi:hypothetical protein